MVLPEEGLATYCNDGDDLMMALARKIVSGNEEEDEAETVEEVFAQARDAEASAEEYLAWAKTGMRWRSNRRPATATTTTASSRPVELILGNGRLPVNGNGHHDEASEPQQSLFSWAEFMAEEPVKPKGRGRKPQPETASLFDWALALEQEREREPVGAGRLASDFES